MAAQQTQDLVLTLTSDEHQELLRLLEASLVDIHGESRRTEAPGYQQKVHRQESIIRSLTEKVRQLGR